MSLRIRRGTEQERIGRTFDQGEIIWTTNGEKLYVGDGVTPGGKNIAAQLAGTNLAFNATTGTLGVTGLTTDLVTEGLNNKYFSAEAAQDAIGAAIAAGSQSGISVVYNDNGAGPASINFTVTGGGGGGLSDIVLDTSPSLGGNLDLNGKNVFGTGSIDIDGNFEVTGSITGDTLILTNGLGSELILNGNDISGTGDVRIGGDFIGTNLQLTGTISALNGLGYNLNLNSRDITGFGGINIVGDIGAVNITADSLTATDISGDLTGNTLGNVTTTIIESTGDYLDIAHQSSTAATTIRRRMPSAVLHTQVEAITAGSYSTGSQVTVSRGTLSSKEIIQEGDALLADIVAAWNGVGYQNTSAIFHKVDADGTVSESSVPGTVGLVVWDNSSYGDFSKSLILNSKGYVTIGHNNTPAQATLDVNGFAKLAVLTSAPASPANGMIAIADGTLWNPAGTGKSVMVIYLGGGWRVAATAP
jgi:hypothetical protein